MNPSPYYVEIGEHDSDGTRYCRLVGPAGAVRWLPIGARDAVLAHMDQLNRLDRALTHDDGAHHFTLGEEGTC